jgi:hypothetical protein
VSFGTHSCGRQDTDVSKRFLREFPLKALNIHILETFPPTNVPVASLVHFAIRHSFE